MRDFIAHLATLLIMSYTLAFAVFVHLSVFLFCSCEDDHMYVGSSCYRNDYVIAVFCSIAGVIIISLVIALIVMSKRRGKKRVDDSTL